MPSLRTVLVAAALAAGAPAPAAEIVFGLGRDDVPNRSGDGATAIGLELRSRPLATLGPFAFAVGGALEIDESDDVWAGAGVQAYLPLRARFRLEASLMVGVYRQGSGIDLGLPLEFRSRIGVSRAVAERWRLGIAYEHKSNAGAGDENPGIETLFATVGYAF